MLQWLTIYFSNYEDFGGGTLWLGAIYFAFQIYCDFSGYSDIAIGTSKLFGFELMSNFKFPYFSRNIGEFWRRWHISLSTWFRDYLYIPLGGSQGREGGNPSETFSLFSLLVDFGTERIGLLYFGDCFMQFYFLPSFIFNTNRKYTTSIIAENTFLPSPKEFIQVGVTFILVTIGWVFFRSETIGDSYLFLKQMVFQIDFPNRFRSGLLYIIPLVILDFCLKEDERTLKTSKNKIVDFIIIQIFLGIIFWFLTRPNKVDFIYFQF